MQNYVTMCMTISSNEYDNLIAHFNGYDIVKEQQQNVQYSLSELIQIKVKNEDKKNPQFISIIEKQNQAILMLYDNENFSIQESNFCYVDRQFLEVMKSNQIFGKRSIKNQICFSMQKYSWKQLYYFQFVHTSSNNVLCIIKDLNGSIFVDTSKTSKKKDFPKMIRNSFQDILKLFSIQRVDQILQKYFIEIDDASKQEFFYANNNINFWMLENGQILNFIMDNKNKMEQQK